MDRDLDPTFHTGPELRKLLRDPRQLEVGPGRSGFRRATAPHGLLTRAIRVAVLSTFCVIVALLLLRTAQPGVEMDWESTAWIWLAVWMGGTAGLIFVVAKLRALLTNELGRAKGSGDETPEVLPGTCGSEDWFSEDIRFVVRTFFL